MIQLSVVLDLLLATALGVVLLTRVTEPRTLWLLRGYLTLVALAWVIQRFGILPLTTKLVDALVMACSLALAILWQGDLRRLMEVLGTGRLDVLFGSQGADKLASGAVAVLSEAATLDDIVAEVAAARQTERGTRADDRRSETAMEDRKKEGYF